MNVYCLGFAFHKSFTHLALIRKNKPDFQKGKLNGLGGRVEEGETPIEAMIREFEEECGVKTSIYQWVHSSTMTFPDCIVYCYAAHLLESQVPRTTTDEPVNWYTIDGDREDDMPNLSFLIPIATRVLLGEIQAQVEIRYA